MSVCLSLFSTKVASPGYSIQWATKDALVDITGDVAVAFFGVVKYSPGRRSIAYLNVVTVAAGKTEARTGVRTGGRWCEIEVRFPRFVLMGQREDLRGLSTAAKVLRRLDLVWTATSELRTWDSERRMQDSGEGSEA